MQATSVPGTDVERSSQMSQILAAIYSPTYLVWDTSPKMVGHMVHNCSSLSTLIISSHYIFFFFFKVHVQCYPFNLQ